MTPEKGWTEYTSIRVQCEFVVPYACVNRSLGTGDMPEKEEVIRDLLEQMSMYPQDTTFFLNVWCFG